MRRSREVSGCEDQVRNDDEEGPDAVEEHEVAAVPVAEAAGVVADGGYDWWWWLLLAYIYTWRRRVCGVMRCLP